MSLSNEELIRYSRHLNLPNFGLETQHRLKKARVLVIGAGGLGAPLLQYLTASGVGTIGVVDFDVIDRSNLQRQVLFDDGDVGKPKASMAIAKLKKQNPNVHFIEHPVRLDSETALGIIENYDLIADGTDNFPTRYLVNDACVLLNKPYVYASIYQFEGQVSVFNHTDKSGNTGPNYRDLFPTPPPPGIVPSCAEGGVLGVLPGIIGSIQASEAIKVLAQIGEPLSGRLFLFDALEFSTRVLTIQKDPNNPLTGNNPQITALVDYEDFCGLKKEKTNTIKVTTLKTWLESEKDLVLIDVREPYEFEAGNIGALNIPLSTVDKNLHKIPKEGQVVVHCKSGRRSARAISQLEDTYGYQNLINLEGGILAWKGLIDPSIQVI